ncbi:MAG: single-stranded-DNA-specific exonuclease RecJ [Parcubacteria bacterium C7867-006]|nr:MAG: single-stranded-DNA-specific exonuclease RecJ [Parcubacteria bacterium C7867-006]
MSKKYALREPIPEKIDKLFEAYSPLVRSLLYSRGIEDLENAESFLNPKYESLHNPFLLKNMDKATERILKAIKENEKIAIFSDYDADGIPGGVTLHDFFKKIGYNNFINYIPLRNEEGFGLNHTAIDNIASQDVKLVITIDCGITDVEQVETANKHGMDVIITDHHIPGKKLPKAFAIINPKQNGCDYPEKMLRGSGVVFKVIQALIIKGKEEKVFDWKDGQEKWFLDMVGLATLSDMVPLLGENRILSYFGMKVLQRTPRVGLLKLLSLLKINQVTLTEDDIGFMVTPRINAASRMGIPLDAFKLLSTTDEVEAGMLAEHLNNKNDERKGVVGSMIKEVKKRIENSDTEMKHVLVFGNPEWKPSLLGLVANSFGDEHNRPVFFWGRNGETEGDGIIKGSCRAGGDTDIVKLMEKASTISPDIFVDYGGHKGAGGFSILQDNIHTLEDRLNKAFVELLNEHKIIEDTLLDKKLSIDDVNWNTYSSVEKFAPFGLDNPKPLFLFENITVSAMKLFGKEKNHLELKFKNSNSKDVTAIAFFQNGDRFAVPVKEGSSINLVATLEKSTFRNFPELRLRIVDVF